VLSARPKKNLIASADVDAQLGQFLDKGSLAGFDKKELVAGAENSPSSRIVAFALIVVVSAPESPDSSFNQPKVVHTFTLTGSPVV
jgi:hypothetical protein